MPMGCILQNKVLIPKIPAYVEIGRVDQVNLRWNNIWIHAITEYEAFLVFHFHKKWLEFL